MTEHLRKQGVLSNICEYVRFARRRFGHYDVIDFVAVLSGYAISGERTGASGAGNGDYRGELRRAMKAIGAYVKAQSVSLSQTVIAPTCIWLSHPEFCLML